MERASLYSQFGRPFLFKTKQNMPAGRPLLFDTPEALQEAIDGYIQTAVKPTLAGLAYHLDIDRHTLYNYKERPEFFHVIKKATDFVESKYEERLIYNNNPAGVIFALKNMGWSDKQEIDQKTQLSIGFSGIEIIQPTKPDGDSKEI